MPIPWPHNAFPILSETHTRQSRQRKRVATLGGGYRQIAPDAINTLEVDASIGVVTHEDRPGQTFADLEVLLSYLNGTDTYEIIFPGKQTKFWEVIDYSESSVSHLVTNVTINLKSWNDASKFELNPPGTKRLVYTPAWSTTISNPVATWTMLQDGPPSGFASAVGVNQWLTADMGQVAAISHVAIQAGSVSGIGNTAALVNGDQIQASVNGTTWVHVQTVAGLTDTGSKVFFPFAEITYARYIRVYSPSQLALSRLEVWGVV